MSHNQAALYKLASDEALVIAGKIHDGEYPSFMDKHQFIRHRLVELLNKTAPPAGLRKLADLALGLADEFEKAVASREPISGMQVTPTGDFIACAQLPSAVSRMRWWAREIRKAEEEGE